MLSRPVLKRGFCSEEELSANTFPGQPLWASIWPHLMDSTCSSFGCKKYSNKIGILVAQLGTPDAPTKRALRPYLKQFLSDPRVIETNRALWWIILNGLVLNTRPKRSSRLYKRIWTDEGSPLMVITKSQTDRVRELLKAKFGSSVEVVFGMRYGNPSLEKGLDSLIAAGCSRILLFPMYPQYSGATSASTYDAVFPHLLKQRWVPTLRVVEPYFDHPAYIKALAHTINESIKALPWQPEKLVLSYHGIPEKYVTKGDPYCCQCTETSAALVPLLDFPKSDVLHTYQSRFGRDPWLRPYTDKTFERLGHEGITRIAVASPGFTADCLETLDELGNEGREQFEEAGGKEFYNIPCVNDHSAWIAAMADIISGEIASWTAIRRSAPCAVQCPLVAAGAE